MYEPKLGRFQSRDPLPENGVELLHPMPDMRRFVRRTAPDDNSYWYVENNPVNSVDPSGAQGVSEPTCEIAIHCWTYLKQRHCGFTLYVNGIPIYIDGGPLANGCVGFTAGVPTGKPDYKEGDRTKHPWKDCWCLYSFALDPVNSNPATCEEYHWYCTNSNWMMNCASQACNITVTWMSKPPIGLDCWKCFKWEVPQIPHGGACPVCVDKRPWPCPGVPYTPPPWRPAT